MVRDKVRKKSLRKAALTYKHKMVQSREMISNFHFILVMVENSRRSSSCGDTQTCRIQNEIPPSSVHIHADTKLKSEVRVIRE